MIGLSSLYQETARVGAVKSHSSFLVWLFVKRKGPRPGHSCGATVGKMGKMRKNVWLTKIADDT